MDKTRFELDIRDNITMTTVGSKVISLNKSNNGMK